MTSRDVDTDEGGTGPGDEPGRQMGGVLHFWPRRDDASLVAAMGTDEPGAIEEFLRRFQPVLLGAARGMGIPREERAVYVADVLTDAAERFASGHPPPRTSLRAYLARWLRMRYVDARRTVRRRERLSRGAGLTDDEGVMLAACSRAALRASRGADPDVEDEGEGVQPALARLARALLAEVSAEQRALLEAVGNEVTQEEIARELGISTRALRQRLYRLRKRMAQLAVSYTFASGGDDQLVLVSFFRRIESSEPVVLSMVDRLARDRRRSQQGEPTTAHPRGTPNGEDDAA